MFSVFEVDTIDPNQLARFRADPKKVRCSIRPCKRGWRATVVLREGGSSYSSEGKDAQKAMMRALKRADDAGIKGIDLFMEWTYTHPMYVK